MFKQMKLITFSILLIGILSLRVHKDDVVVDSETDKESFRLCDGEPCPTDQNNANSATKDAANNKDGGDENKKAPQQSKQKKEQQISQKNDQQISQKKDQQGNPIKGKVQQSGTNVDSSSSDTSIIKPQTNQDPTKVVKKQGNLAQGKLPTQGGKQKQQQQNAASGDGKGGVTQGPRKNREEDKVEEQN
jgi:hypothetical protein